MFKLSIITPIYNTERYLELCLKKLVSQSIPDVELIWVDNGSNSECKQIIKNNALYRNNIKVITLEENVGYGQALCIGLKQACGSYIGFCDSDDWVDTDFFEKMYNAAIKNDADIVYSTHRREYKRTYRINKIGLSNFCATRLSEKINMLSDGAIWDKIFKSSIVKKSEVCIPTPSKSWFEDNLFLIPFVYHANKIIKINGSFYHYRQTNNSITRDPNFETLRIKYAVDIFSILVDFSNRHTFLDEEKIALFRFATRSLSIHKALSSELLKKSLYNIAKNDDAFHDYIDTLEKRSLKAYLYVIVNKIRHKLLLIVKTRIKFTTEW